MSKDWQLSSFEDAYRKVGYYESHYEWRAKAGIPRIFTDYTYPRIQGRLLDWLKPLPNSKILEVGCGVGWFLFEIQNKYAQQGLELTGMDVVESNIVYLRQRIEKSGQNNIQGLVASSEASPFGSEEFDLIVCSEVIEHILNKEKALREMYRVLKKGGRLLLSTPNQFAHRFWEAVFFAPGLVRKLFKKREAVSAHSGPYDVPLYPAELKRMLSGAGFKILRFEKNVFLPHESYFGVFPYWLSVLFVKIGGFVEKHFYKYHCWLGLRMAVECTKE